ncbi:beta-ketoacyl synthase N-terminal-like domain-containing protein, partial [Bacillus atrophaeus]|uniref:type I polyketide synthase n=2 Tax=Bacillus atrophaeus TaxID=1452 RepID=UPI003CF9C6F6
MNNQDMSKGKRNLSTTTRYSAKTLDMAIVGIACRFPEAENYEEYWDNLKNGRSSIKEIPKDRWNWKEFRTIGGEYKSNSVSKWGGFVDNVNTFDVRFFGLSNREADAMDPQQRMMLELTWSCFEDAGIRPSNVSGDKIGVFLGAFNFDYKELIERSQERIVPHYSTGTSSAIIPNRISYYYNLKGPSLEIDNACSGSITALHTACQSIMNGDCEMALAGGVSILLSPSRQISFSQMGMLSPSGSCKAFDQDADGYVRGEGAGIVLIKPFHKALADGDPIHGIIKGSAINHGGKTFTLTYPNPDAQADVIIEAVKRANVSFDSINYIEAHGTGTPKGDPIEFEGLMRASQALSKEKDKTKTQCGLGSVKTNIGHLESAAGIAGVIKVLMAMKYGKLPGNLGYHQINPKIPIDTSPFSIVDQLKEWKSLKDGEEVIPRRAGVSSFGFGGTNGHVILEEHRVVKKTKKPSKSHYFFGLSAKTDESLKQKIIDLKNWLEKNSDQVEIADVSATLLFGRELFKKRIAVIADGVSDLREKLAAVLENQERDECIRRNMLGNEDWNALSKKIGKAAESIKEIKNRHTVKYKKQLIHLAEFYVAGYDFEWEKVFYTAGRRISLPTYPFARESCWMPPVKVLAEGTNHIENFKDIESKPQQSNIHPLVHENTSD